MSSADLPKVVVSPRPKRPPAITVRKATLILLTLLALWVFNLAIPPVLQWLIDVMVDKLNGL